MARYLYSELASILQARSNCLKSFQSTGVDTGWFDRHSQRIEQLVRDNMPSGSGFDDGTDLDLDASHSEKLVFNTKYHHMNEGGYYDGWTSHQITVTPSLANDFHLRISGRNRNDIKEYIHECFNTALMLPVERLLEVSK